MFKEFDKETFEERMDKLNNGWAVSLFFLHGDVLGQVHNILIESFLDPVINTEESHEKTLQYLKPLLEDGKLVMVIPTFEVMNKEKKQVKVGKPYRLYDHTNTDEGIKYLRNLWNNFEIPSSIERFVGFLLPEFKDKDIVDALCP